jgi:hypothetical protein
MSATIAQLRVNLGRFRPRTPFESYLMDPEGRHRITEQSARAVTNALSSLRSTTIDGERVAVYTEEQILYDDIDKLVMNHPAVKKARAEGRVGAEVGKKKAFRRAMRVYREFNGVPEEGMQ